MNLLMSAAKAALLIAVFTMVIILGLIFGLWFDRGQSVAQTLIAVLVLFVMLTFGIFVAERKL